MILDFIKLYWKEILYCIGFLVVTLVTLLSKKVKNIDTIKETILNCLPDFINMVERPGEGSDKLHEVVTFVIGYVSKLYPGLDLNKYVPFIRKSIEKILSTPQKKGR